MASIEADSVPVIPLPVEPKSIRIKPAPVACPNPPPLPPLSEPFRTHCFTHKSAARDGRTANKWMDDPEDTKDNEAMEFYGDAIMKSSVGLYLKQRWPRLRQGPLTTITARIVCNDQWAVYALAYGFDEELILPPSANEWEVRRNTLVMAGVFECYCAGIYQQTNKSLNQLKILNEWVWPLITPCADNAYVEEKKAFAEIAKKLPGTVQGAQPATSRRALVVRPATQMDTLESTLSSHIVKFSDFCGRNRMTVEWRRNDDIPDDDDPSQITYGYNVVIQGRLVGSSAGCFNTKEAKEQAAARCCQFFKIVT